MAHQNNSVCYSSRFLIFCSCAYDTLIPGTHAVTPRQFSIGFLRVSFREGQGVLWKQENIESNSPGGAVMVPGSSIQQDCIGALW
jgi:hypothetical protein